MLVIEAQNAHEALPMALRLLDQRGVRRESRNGPVIVIPEPVTVVYKHPLQRVMFWAERDANPFFHLAEALWMIAGRNDVEFPAIYAKQIATYSDNGETLHGAYGHRWRKHFEVDQLVHIGETLRKNPEDRRCVLAMWDTRVDLVRNGKDLPCNTIATLSRNHTGSLDLTVFQRSGDVIWGVLGANVVHMSFMQEYVAALIGCPVGTYHQVVTNFHAYVEVFQKLAFIRPDHANYIDNPYMDGRVIPTPLGCSARDADRYIGELLYTAEHGLDRRLPTANPFFNQACALLRAHQAWRTGAAEDRYLIPLDILSQWPQKSDWIVAATQWIERRYDKWKQRFVLTGDENQ